jgi:hypothetical protein
MGTSLGVADTMALISSKLSNLVPFGVRAVPLRRGAGLAALQVRDRLDSNHRQMTIKRPQAHRLGDRAGRS